MKKTKLAKITVSAMLGLGILNVSEVALNSNSQVVQAATSKKKLTKNAYIYNSKGHKTKAKKLRKGKKVKIYATKKIKGKKYYRIGKNKYVRTANFARKKSNAIKLAVQKTTKNTISKSSNLGSITLTNNLDYEFRLADSNGNPIDSWIDGNTTWKVLGTKTINGKKYYKIDGGWLNEDYLKAKPSSSVKNSTNGNETNQQATSTPLDIKDSSTSSSSDTSTNSSVNLTPELIRETETEFIKLVNDWRASQGLSPVTSNENSRTFAQERAKHNANSWSNFGTDDNHEGHGVYGELEYLVNLGSATQMATDAFNKFVYDDGSAEWGHRDYLREPTLRGLSIGLASTTNKEYYRNAIAFNVEGNH
ncbi:SLAP domain-containing protein [Lactobacillus sp. PV037]|uniref:SLAP domain-containing protein n=1 Tax=Lactobacillus sp. PV037 TaxID=2594496 RepID=UPI00223ECDB1|nr:SLAP domain-containing protein [Lactobacillus sp. PV037]